MQRSRGRKSCLLRGGSEHFAHAAWGNEGIRLYLYVTRAPNSKYGEVLFRSMHNIVSRENGGKTAINKVKLDVRRSEPWERADTAHVRP